VIDGWVIDGWVTSAARYRRLSCKAYAMLLLSSPLEDAALSIGARYCSMTTIRHSEYSV
jgi:hypothetical protein